MTYRWYLNASGLISGTSIFPPQKSRVRPSSGAHSTYGIKTMMKTCPGSHSTFRIGRLDDLSYCHGAGASQRGHFGGYFGSPGHLTVRAPEGSPGGRRVLRTIIDLRDHAFDELGLEISWVKGGPGNQTGGWGLGQSGGPLSPGGECFAPCMVAAQYPPVIPYAILPTCDV